MSKQPNPFMLPGFNIELVNVNEQIAFKVSKVADNKALALPDQDVLQFLDQTEEGPSKEKEEVINIAHDYLKTWVSNWEKVLRDMERAFIDPEKELSFRKATKKDRNIIRVRDLIMQVLDLARYQEAKKYETMMDIVIDRFTRLLCALTGRVLVEYQGALAARAVPGDLKDMLKSAGMKEKGFTCEAFRRAYRNRDGGYVPPSLSEKITNLSFFRLPQKSKNLAVTLMAFNYSSTVSKQPSRGRRATKRPPIWSTVDAFGLSDQNTELSPLDIKNVKTLLNDASKSANPMHPNPKAVASKSTANLPEPTSTASTGSVTTTTSSIPPSTPSPVSNSRPEFSIDSDSVSRHYYLTDLDRHIMQHTEINLEKLNKSIKSDVEAADQKYQSCLAALKNQGGTEYTQLSTLLRDNHRRERANILQKYQEPIVQIKNAVHAYLLLSHPDIITQMSRLLLLPFCEIVDELKQLNTQSVAEGPNAPTTTSTAKGASLESTALNPDRSVPKDQVASSAVREKVVTIRYGQRSASKYIKENTPTHIDVAAISKKIASAKKTLKKEREKHNEALQSLNGDPRGSSYKMLQGVINHQHKERLRQYVEANLPYLNQNVCTLISNWLIRSSKDAVKQICYMLLPALRSYQNSPEQVKTVSGTTTTTTTTTTSSTSSRDNSSKPSLKAGPNIEPSNSKCPLYIKRNIPLLKRFNEEEINDIARRMLAMMEKKGYPEGLLTFHQGVEKSPEKISLMAYLERHYPDRFTSARPGVSMGWLISRLCKQLIPQYKEYYGTTATTAESVNAPTSFPGRGSLLFGPAHTDARGANRTQKRKRNESNSTTTGRKAKKKGAAKSPSTVTKKAKPPEDSYLSP